MKICPQCDRTYHDDELNFCLMCGTALVDGASQPTVVIPSGGEPTVAMSGRQTVKTERKRGFWFWIGVIAASIVGVTGATFGIFFVYFFIKADGNTNYNRPSIPNSSSSKRSQAKPASTPLPEPTPAASPEQTRVNEDAVPTIGWTVTALEYEAEEDETRTFICSPDGTESAIYGSDTYAANSSICTAAVHAGMMTFADGGEVTIKFRSGLPNYLVTKRHGITSNTFGVENLSFVFVHYAE